MLKKLLPAALIACSSGAIAQAYPNKPVHVVVPYAAGGTVDTVARAYGIKLGELWGQPVVIDNRAGAGGNIGADAVAKSAPDGYNVMLTTQGHAISPGLYRKLPFDAMKDFSALAQITSSYLLLVGEGRLPGSLREVLAMAKQQPGKLNFGSTGPGSAPHLAGELLVSLGDVKLVHVPYKGDAPLMPALIAGEVQLAFVPMAAGLPHVKAGKLRALGMTGAKRSPTIPDVPTMPEAGVKDYELVGWLGFFGPAGVSRDIANKFAADAGRVTRNKDILDKLPGWGYEPVVGTPEEFAAKYRDDVAMYAKLIKQASIPLID